MGATCSNCGAPTTSRALQPQPPRRHHKWRWVAGGAAVLLIGGIAAGAAAGGGGKAPAPAATPSAAASTTTPVYYTDPNGQTCDTLAVDPDGYCPGSTAPSEAPSEASAPVTEAPTTQAPAMTASQQQAITAAQSYLDLGSGFSYQGLLKQLTSEYGSGFTQADAKFAIHYLKPDWNAQAVQAAKAYLDLGTGFSRAGLINQLTSEYGSGFTQAQAEYAAKAVGL